MTTTVEQPPQKSTGTAGPGRCGADTAGSAGTRFGVPDVPRAPVRDGGRPGGHRRPVSGLDRWHPAQAAQCHQHHSAERLHTGPGDRDGHRDHHRSHRSVRRLDRRIHRRHVRCPDGAQRHAMAGGGRRCVWAWRDHRCVAGILDRLRRHPVVHRHARRHARVPRRHAVSAGRPVDCADAARAGTGQQWLFARDRGQRGLSLADGHSRSGDDGGLVAYRSVAGAPRSATVKRFRDRAVRRQMRGDRGGTRGRHAVARQLPRGADRGHHPGGADLVYAFVMRNTVLGRQVSGRRKPGGAALSGIRNERTTLLVFVNMGMLAASRACCSRRG